MRMNLRSNKARNLFLTVMLIVAMALTVTGCGDKERDEASQPRSSEEQQSQGGILGEGQTVIYFTVVDREGNETAFEIHTDKETVGDALLEHKLIAGDESEYGLYVKQVNGITADYDVDKTYWAFYIGGEYALTGVDVTPVKAEETYAFKIQK